MLNKDIYTIGGTVSVNHGVYIPRKTDEELLNYCRAGLFAYVLTSRQLGKSSLMVQTARRLAEEGKRTVIIDLAQIGTATPEEWYLGVLVNVADQLQLKTDVFSWWQDHSELSVTNRLTAFFETVLLAEVSDQTIIFIDEIDTTLNLQFRDDFFASIRYFYNSRAHKPQFNRLTFVLIGTATPGDLIEDPLRTPFNIGHWVFLSDFTFEEALPLAKGLGLPEAESLNVLKWILQWTGGHPYLTQRICRIIAEQTHQIASQSDVDSVVANVFLGEKGKHDSNLEFVREMLTKRVRIGIEPSKLLRTYRRILRGRFVPDEEQSLIKNHLKLSGIVRRQELSLQVRNRIYEKVFDRGWVSRMTGELPTNWKRLAYQAAATLIVLVLLTLIPLSAIAINRASAAEYALQDARRATENETRAKQQAEAALQREQQARQQLEQALSREKIAKIDLEESLVRETVAKSEAVQQRKVAEEQREEADTLRQVAHSREIAAKASAQLPSDPELAVLLSTEALQLNNTVEAKDSLRQALLGFRLKTTFNGHQKVVRRAEFLPNGKLIVSVSDGDVALVWDAATGQTLHTLKGHDGQVNSAEFSPDGKRIVTAGVDGTARIWDSTSGKNIRTLQGHSKSVSTAAFSPDNKLIVTSSLDQTERVWDVGTGHCIHVLQSGVPVSKPKSTSSQDPAASKPDSTSTGEVVSVVSAVDFPPTASMNLLLAGLSLLPLSRSEDDFQGARSDPFDLDDETFPMWKEPPPTTARFSPIGGFILVKTPDGLAEVWSGETGTRLFDLKGHTGKLHSPVFSPNGKYILARVDTPRWPNQLYVWNTSNGAVVLSMNDHTEGPFESSFSPDSKYIVAGGEGNTVMLQSIETKEYSLFRGHTSSIQSVAFSPDGKYLATTDRSNTARVWDTTTGQNSFILQGHTDVILGISFSPDGKNIVTSGGDGTARVWSLTSTSGSAQLDDVKDLKAPEGVLSPNGESLAAKGDDYITRVYEVSTGRLLFKLQDRETSIPTFSRDGRYLLTAEDNVVQVRKASTGESVQLLRGHTGRILNTAFSADNRLIISASEDSTARVWETTTGQSSLILSGHRGDVRSAEFSPNSDFILTASADYTARLWEAATGKQIRVLIHTKRLSMATFSANGRYIATVDEDGWTYVWDTITFKNVPISGLSFSKRAYPNDVVGIGNIFSPDSRSIMTAGPSNTVLISDVVTGRRIAVLQGHTDTVWTMSFSPSGEVVVTTSEDGTIRFWDAKTGRSLNVFENNREESDDNVRMATFVGNNQRIITLTAGGFLQSYDCEICGSVKDLMNSARSRLTRNLSRNEREIYLHLPPAK